MSNSWWEIKIICDPVQEESVTWRLEEFGCSGTAREVEHDLYSIRAYVPQAHFPQEKLEDLTAKINQDADNLSVSHPQIKSQQMDEEDWASSWKQHWQPRPIGDRLIICPAWLSQPPQWADRMCLKLDPGVAFGTAEHPTTQLCLESLEMRLAYNKEANQRIVDIGCGSGVLSIAALLFGAKQVSAVDTDPLAVEATLANAELNGISSDRLIVKQGSWQQLESESEAGIDGIVCNILAEVVMDLIPWMSVVAKPHTWGILSGIMVDQAQAIYQSLEDHGWIVATLWKRGQWCCFNVRQES